MKTAIGNVVFATLLNLLLGVQVFAQGTAFTYQGRLNANGAAATGTYDFQFTAYDAPTAGGSIGAPVTISGVAVASGLFAITLDFGTGVFTGPARWLQISVRTNGAVTFTNLSPRQALTPSPYAIHAGTASNVVEGAVVKSLNNLRDNVMLAAGSNVTITPAGNALTISVPTSGSSNWFGSGGNTYVTSGNVGIGTTTPANKLTVRTPTPDYGFEHTDGDVRLGTYAGGPGGGWLGTISPHKLSFFVNSGPARMTVDTTGNVGVGTTTPHHQLSISGGPTWTGSDWGGAVELDNAAAIAWRGNAAGNHFGIGQSGGGLYFFSSASEPGTAGSLANYHMTIGDNGYVGIGAFSPQSKLHLYEPANSVSHLIETSGGINAWAKATFKNLNGQWDIGTSRGFNNDVFYMDRIGTSPLEFQLAANGRLGLGIEPLAKLHLYEADNSVSQRIQSGGGINAWTRIEFVNANGQWDIGTSRSFNGDQLYFYRQGAPGIAFSIQPNGDAFLAGNVNVNGNVSIGTQDTTQAKLHVAGDTTAVSGITSWTYGVYGRTTRNDLSSAGVYGESGGNNSWSGLFFGPFKVAGNLYGQNADFLGEVTADNFIERSDRNVKANFATVDSRTVLDRLLRVSVQTWNFTNQSASVRHMGPMAQDFHAAFQVGQDDKHISTIDVGGVAFAAIQGLDRKLVEELKRRDAENAELKERLTALEELMKSLPEKFTGAAR